MRPLLTVDLSRVEGAEQAINVGSFLTASTFIRDVQSLALGRHGDQHFFLPRPGDRACAYARHFAILLLKMRSVLKMQVWYVSGLHESRAPPLFT